MKTLKIEMEIETDDNKEWIEAFIRYNLKILNIKNIKIGVKNE
jgi:hypothetical protein